MQKRARILTLTALALVVIGAALYATLGNGGSGRAAIQSLFARQYANSVRVEDQLIPGQLQRHLTQQRFEELLAQMPAFDRPNFGPGVRTYAWRTSPWVITMVLQARDGALFPVLAYAKGPGIQQTQYAALLAGHMKQIGAAQWQAILRVNPHGLIDGNFSPVTCADRRGTQSPYIIAGGPTVGRITRSELARATRGLSDLADTSFACHRFAGSDYLEFASGSEGMQFRIVGSTLVPASRGAIDFADAHGSFMILHAGTLDANGNQVNDYLEVLRASL